MRDAANNSFGPDGFSIRSAEDRMLGSSQDLEGFTRTASAGGEFHLPHGHRRAQCLPLLFQQGSRKISKPLRGGDVSGQQCRYYCCAALAQFTGLHSRGWSESCCPTARPPSPARDCIKRGLDLRRRRRLARSGRHHTGFPMHTVPKSSKRLPHEALPCPSRELTAAHVRCGSGRSALRRVLEVALPA